MQTYSRPRQFGSILGPFRRIHGPPGRIDIASVVGTKNSDSVSGDLIIFEGTILEYEMPYDDLIYVLDGTRKIATTDGEVGGGPSDVLWVPKGEKVAFSSEGKTTVFCATYPVNWDDLTDLGKT